MALLSNTTSTIVATAASTSLARADVATTTTTTTSTFANIDTTSNFMIHVIILFSDYDLDTFYYAHILYTIQRQCLHRH